MSSIYEVPDQLAPPPPAPRRGHLRVVPPPAAVPPLDFDEVVRSLTPRLQRYATRRLGDRHEAEELVQEALLRAYDHRAELATEDDVAAWSTCVTGRLVIDRLRVRGRSVNVAEVPEGTRVGRDTADVVVARDEARTALDALDAMPARQAAVLWAREVEGLAYGEIGERFDLTEPAVRSLLSRARKTLRREFETRGGTLPAAGLVALAPWVDGLTWADRLRRAAARAAAPAALGVAGLGVLAGVVPLPWSSPETTAPTSRPAVSVAAVAATSAPPAAAPPAATTPVVPPATPPSAPAPQADEPAGRRSITDLTGVNDRCVEVVGDDRSALVASRAVGLDPAEGVGAGGGGCAPQTGSTVYVGPSLPDNPTGIDRVGVSLDTLRCSDLPATTPLIQCTTTDGADR